MNSIFFAALAAAPFVTAAASAMRYAWRSPLRAGRRPDPQTSARGRLLFRLVTSQTPDEIHRVMIDVRDAQIPGAYAQCVHAINCIADDAEQNGREASPFIPARATYSLTDFGSRSPL